jgi:hypothetical protein
MLSTSELDAESIATLIKGGATALSVALGSKPAALLIEKVSSALGWYMEPRQIVRKAKAEVAANIIKIEADQEAKSLEQRISIRIINEEARRQHNMESIVVGALPNIKDDANPKDIDNDWIDSFFEKCRLVSNEDMRMLWSHILAGEANKPGSFSVRTLNILSTFTKAEAVMYKLACSLVWTDEELKPTIIAPDKVIAHEDKPGEIDVESLYKLVEMGLMLYEPESEFLMRGDNMTYSYGNKTYSIRMRNPGKDAYFVMGLPVGFVTLTQVGRELYSIVEPVIDESYMNYIVSYWKSRKFLVEIIPK